MKKIKITSIPDENLKTPGTINFAP